MLYTAADDDQEIATYDDLLGAYELDGFVLTGTHHGDPRTAWLGDRGVPVRDLRPALGRPRRRTPGSTSTAPPAPPRPPRGC